MPYYRFSNPNDQEETIDVFFHMDENKEYIDENGVKWNREFFSVNAAVDTRINPFSKNDFVNKTASKKGSYGDILDYSKELGEKRKEIAGEDSIKNSYYKNYKKTRNGREHRDVVHERAKQNLDKLGVTVN